MGKFNEYSQKATPEDADSLMIYDAAAKANKLLSFSGIWNWIVGKLTNAVISNLQTNNKTVLGAINELNSNTLHCRDLNARITIDNNTKNVSVFFGSIGDSEKGIIVINGGVGAVIFSVLISYGTKWSCELIAFNSSNVDPTSAVLDNMNKKLQFKATTDLEGSAASVTAKLI